MTKAPALAIALLLLLLAACSSTPTDSDETASDSMYADCAAVVAAGADPLLQGQPGFDPRLDRDGDGRACEQDTEPETTTTLSEPAADRSDLAVMVESSLAASFGVESLSQTCQTSASWPCYVNGVDEPLPGTIVLTIQESGVAAEEFGRDAARAAWTLLPLEVSDRIEIIQAVDAQGSPIDTVSRFEVPTLN